MRINQRKILLATAGVFVAGVLATVALASHDRAVLHKAHIHPTIQFKTETKTITKSVPTLPDSCAKVISYSEKMMTDVEKYEQIIQALDAAIDTATIGTAEKSITELDKAQQQLNDLKTLRAEANVNLSDEKEQVDLYKSLCAKSTENSP